MKPDTTGFVPPTYDLRELGDGLAITERLEALADSFVKLALERVGPAFVRVPEFAARAATEIGRDQERFRSTTMERYLVDLVACVVMNRQFWPAFVDRRDTVLILPDCLRLRGRSCERKRSRYGSRCTVCEEGCAVARITVAAAKHRAAAFFSDRDHEKQFALLRRGRYDDLSVIGVACIWMLANGMREAEEAGVPAQGVPLTYCGCEHWSDQEQVTDTVVEQVERILAAKFAARAARVARPADDGGHVGS